MPKELQAGNVDLVEVAKTLIAEKPERAQSLLASMIALGLVLHEVEILESHGQIALRLGPEPRQVLGGWNENDLAGAVLDVRQELTPLFNETVRRLNIKGGAPARDALIDSLEVRLNALYHARRGTPVDAHETAAWCAGCGVNDVARDNNGTVGLCGICEEETD